MKVKKTINPNIKIYSLQVWQSKYYLLYCPLRDLGGRMNKFTGKYDWYDYIFWILGTITIIWTLSTSSTKVHESKDNWQYCSKYSNCDN